MILCSITILKERTGFPTGGDFAAITDDKDLGLSHFGIEFTGKINLIMNVLKFFSAATKMTIFHLLSHNLIY